MKLFRALFILLISASLLTGCLTAAKLDSYVAGLHGDKVPKQEKMKVNDIVIKSTIPFPGEAVSVSNRKTTGFVPAIVYIQYNFRHTCKLNPVIGLNHLIKSINSNAQQRLNSKLAGRKLELTVEQMPGTFAFVDKGRMVLLTVRWNKIYIEPDTKDLIVSYKLQDDSGGKTGRVIIANKEKRAGVRFAQGWKSWSSEYLDRYAVDMRDMGRELVQKITDEI